MKYTTYSEVKSSLIFKYKAYLKKILVLIFSRSKFKIFINSTNELIISRYLEKTISKIRIADTVESIEKINNLKFRKFIFDNFKFISEGIQVLWVMYLLDCKEMDILLSLVPAMDYILVIRICLKRSLGGQEF